MEQPFCKTAEQFIKTKHILNIPNCIALLGIYYKLKKLKSTQKTI